MKKRDTRGLVFWKPAVLAWRQSDLTQKEYCSRHGLNLHALRNWSRKVPGKAKPRPRHAKLAGKFSPIRLVAENGFQTRSSYELHLDHGRRLTVPLDCDVSHVAALVKSLES